MNWFQPAAGDAKSFAAFQASERDIIIRNNRVACILGVIFMPMGFLLDYFVYPKFVPPFFGYRVLCSVLLGLVWFLFATDVGKRFYRSLGLVEVSLPMVFMALMIFKTDGGESPYYAGINLVIVGTGILLRWRLIDTLWMFLIGLGLYLLACLTSGIGELNIFFNNVYFLIVTAVFSITGSYFYEQLRFSEFRLRTELRVNQEELEKQNGKLVEMDRVKSQFYANISHELRTPLTLLLTPMDALLAKQKEGWAPESSELLRTMQTNGMRLLKLINDLLDLVRLDSGRMEVNREKVDVGEFLNGMVASVRQAAEKRKIQIAAVVDDACTTGVLDRDKMEKVLLNLVFNALKFTGVGGTIKVEAKNVDSVLQLRVVDTGAGIPSDKVPFIFDRFWQVDNSSQRKHRGAGIGLALVKEFVEVQGGKVNVESVEGSGTQFEILLPQRLEDVPVQMEVSPVERDIIPLESNNPNEEKPAEWLEELFRRAELFPALATQPSFAHRDDWGMHGKLPKVLVADDEPDMLTFLRGQLDSHYQVLDAVDGQQALDKAVQFLPDAILLDMMMPEKDGLEVCRELRSRTSTQNIPVILLTARADEETKLKALDAGANDFLAKPFSLTEMHIRLKNLVDLYEHQRQLGRQKQILESTLEQLKETETQLVQSEKMASLGKLAAGIIHEINNPLNFSKSGIYMLKQFRGSFEAEDQSDFDDVLKDIQEGIERVIGIVSDLRGFSHPDVGLMKEASVESMITSTLRLLSNEWKDKVDIEVDIESGLVFEANANQISQVLINLVQNAIDATGRKTYDDDEKPRIDITGTTRDDQTVILIRDNGPGISEEHLGRIFDPFFTTRDVGEGVGLGLSICYKIIERHAGHVDVRTEFGKFCEFELAFPKFALAEAVPQE